MDNFFYNLNDKLNAIRDLPSTTHGQLNERDMSRAAKGYEKYGKEGMEALAKAGRDGKSLDPVRAKYDKYDEGIGDVARKVGGMAKKVGGKVLDKLGHDSDADMIRDLQKKMGVPQTGMKPGSEPNPKVVKEKMSPAKTKSFAALAEPKDKITFADKIAGAKKEVDEMLGDVAAEAMKQALGGGRGRSSEMDEETKTRKIAGNRYGGARQVDKPEHDDSSKAQTQRGRGRPKKNADSETGEVMKPDWSAFGVGKVKLPAHKGAVTKHKMVGEAVNEEDIEVLERLMDEAFAEGNKALGNALQTALERIQGDQDEDQYDDDEQVNEKAVSKKQAVAARIARGVQKGEVKAKPGSASAEMSKMKTGELKKFAKTDTKGLPDKKKPEAKTDSSNKAPKKKKEVEETTSSGSVATGGSSGGKGGVYGKGIYDSINREVEAMIAESMSINMSMNNDEHGGPSKSLTVTATDDDAMKLSQLLKSAGIGGDDQGYGGTGYQSACGCSESGCGCDDMEESLDENNPDWPTEPTGQEDNINYYDTDGLNGRKSTGQSTVPVLASQDDRQHSYAEAEEDAIKRMMEMAGIAEAKGKKPDFLDVDKDGDKKEPFKKAVDDKDADTTNKDLEESLMRQLSNFKK